MECDGEPSLLAPLRSSLAIASDWARERRHKILMMSTEVNERGDAVVALR